MHIAKKVHFSPDIAHRLLKPLGTFLRGQFDRGTDRHEELGQVLILNQHELMAHQISQKVPHVVPFYFVLAVPSNEVIEKVQGSILRRSTGSQNASLRLHIGIRGCRVVLNAGAAWQVRGRIRKWGLAFSFNDFQYFIDVIKVSWIGSSLLDIAQDDQLFDLLVFGNADIQSADKVFQ